MIIGKNSDTKENVNLDLDRLVTTRLLIQAGSGAGKSWLLRRFLEQSNGKAQQIIIDMEGEYSTLREKYDYLLVGHGGEIQASIKSADLLARKLLQLNLSTIIDLSELKKHERYLFVKRFIDALVNSPKNLWHPAYIVLDEIHNFAPQTSKSESLGSVIDLATRGRKRGFSLIGATQRISKLHKDVSAECGNKLIGRTGQDVDRKRAGEELGFTTKEDIRSLRDLKDGEFYAFGPAISTDVQKVKVGSIQTSHPDPRQVGTLPPSKTPKNIEKILKDVSDLEQEAEEELKTLNDYKNKVAELTRKLTLTQKSVSKENSTNTFDTKALEKAKAEGFRDAEAQYSQTIRDLKETQKSLNLALNKYKKSIQQIGKTINNLSDVEINLPEVTQGNSVTQVKPRLNQSVSSVTSNSHQVSNSTDIPKASRKIYSFLFENANRTFTINQVSFATGYRINGGFMNSIYVLTNRGLAIKEGSNLRVGDLNSEIANEPVGKFNQEFLFKRLNKASIEILKILLENPDEEYSKQELADLTGYSYNGGFNNSVYSLTGAKIAIKTNGRIKLNPEVLEL